MTTPNIKKLVQEEHRGRKFKFNSDAHTHRFVCDVLNEIKNVLKTTTIFTYKRNTSVLVSLVAEMQVYLNRMEAALEYGRDLKQLHQIRKNLIQECTGLAET